MRILIVDDDYVSRMVLSGILSSYGSCKDAGDGEEGLALFEAALNARRPYDLVCLDILMPGLDGTQTLTRLREMEKKRGITGGKACKVMMVSMVQDMKTVFHVYREGLVDAYLTKPFVESSILEKLREMGLVEG